MAFINSGRNPASLRGGISVAPQDHKVILWGRKDVDVKISAAGVAFLRRVDLG